MRSSLFALLVFASVVAAQPARPSVKDLSPLDRQKEHFYGAIAGARRVAVTWTVSPASAPMGSDITLTLTVSNVSNPHELVAPPLADMPDLQRLFSTIELGQQPKPDPPESRVEFRYKVRPRNEGNFTIPELTYVFAVHAGGRTQFQTTRAEAVTFSVTKPVVPKADPRPLDGPPSFFELREGRFVRSGAPGVGWWIGLFGGAIMIGFAWVFGWRWMYPDAARLARIRRNRAVRTALDRLRVAPKRADPLAETAAAFRGYLIGRYGVPYTAQTPHEIAGALQKLDFPAERITTAEQLLRESDAVRYGGAVHTLVTPAVVVALIELWEGVRA